MRVRESLPAGYRAAARLGKFARWAARCCASGEVCPRGRPRVRRGLPAVAASGCGRAAHSPFEPNLCWRAEVRGVRASAHASSRKNTTGVALRGRYLSQGACCSHPGRGLRAGTTTSEKILCQRQLGNHTRGWEQRGAGADRARPTAPAKGRSLYPEHRTQARTRWRSLLARSERGVDW